MPQSLKNTHSAPLSVPVPFFLDQGVRNSLFEARLMTSTTALVIGFPKNTRHEKWT